MNQLWSRCSQNKPMWSKCSHQPYGENILGMSLGKFQMTANCYEGSNVVYMLMLHSKCCINVPMGSRSNTWSGYIWNVPNLLLVGKWQVPSTRAYNVLKMFSLVSRPPRPQWDCVCPKLIIKEEVQVYIPPPLVLHNHLVVRLTLLDHPMVGVLGYL